MLFLPKLSFIKVLLVNDVLQMQNSSLLAAGFLSRKVAKTVRINLTSFSSKGRIIEVPIAVFIDDSDLAFDDLIGL